MVKYYLGYAKQIASLQYQYTTALNNQSENIKHSITIGSIPVIIYIILLMGMHSLNEIKVMPILLEIESAELKSF